MRKPSVYSLVVTNLIPIFGVLFLHWSLFSVMFFYWLESAIVGAYNIPKMMMATVSTDGNKSDTKAPYHLTGRLGFSGFFLVHYGMFVLGHGLFVFELFGPADLSLQAIMLGVIALLVSHGISFKLNYIDSREYRKVSIAQQMFAPYKRIVIMHVTIIIGGLLVDLVGAPVVALVFMVLLKIGIDIYSHTREHTKLGTFAKPAV